jgi:hypothetical protein
MTASEIFLDYTQHSTIEGLIYIFFAYQVNFQCDDTFEIKVTLVLGKITTAIQ